MEVVFAVSLMCVFHAYLGYPISLMLIGLFRRRSVRKSHFQPEVSLIIAACNEEMKIRAKLENTLSLDYPPSKLQIIVTSDGSTDKTNDIVRSYRGKGVQLVECPERKGKENAQKVALGHATGEVIVFSDVATRLDPKGLAEIVANFSDPGIGCVSSVDRVVGRDGKPCGEGFYVKYEMWLRGLESAVCSLVGLSGSFFAARREVCSTFQGDVQSDFRTLLASIHLGLRGVSDPDAVGYYQDISDSKREFDRKVRTVLRGMTVFFRNLAFLDLFKFKLFSYQYFCHKLLRWLVPLFLVTAFFSNALLALHSALYRVVLALQLIFYVVAIIGRSGKSSPSGAVLKIPTYFVTVNLAIVMAWWQFLRGKRLVMWSPSQR